MTPDPRAESAIGRLRPSTGRYLIADSPVDEEQRSSGLIVPLGVSVSSHDAVTRGVITARDETASECSLSVGTVVYFTSQHCYRVLDTWVALPEDIVAYEDPYA